MIYMYVTKPYFYMDHPHTWLLRNEMPRINDSTNCRRRKRCWRRTSCRRWKRWRSSRWLCIQNPGAGWHENTWCWLLVITDHPQEAIVDNAWHAYAYSHLESSHFNFIDILCEFTHPWEQCNTLVWHRCHER